MTAGVRFYMGRFRVPRWLFEVSPDWLHRLADGSIRGERSARIARGEDGAQ